MIYSLALGPNSIVIIHDTKITRIIAPKSDGTIAIPATCGPQAPRPRLEMSLLAQQ